MLSKRREISLWETFVGLIVSLLLTVIADDGALNGWIPPSLTGVLLEPLELATCLKWLKC